MIYAKPAKIANYVALVLHVLHAGKASQRELQVVGGGLVYIAMFKSGLNQLLWIVLQLSLGVLSV